MKFAIKKLFVIVAILLLAPVSANAAIFSGSVDDGGDTEGVGYCLQNPDASTCLDDAGNYVCDAVDDGGDIRCLSDIQTGTGKAKNSLSTTGITHTDDAGNLIIKYVNFVLPYLTLAAFLGFVVAGIMYVTAFGNDEQIDKAKKILIWSIVGLLLVITSFTIVQFFTDELVTSLQQG